MPRFRLPLAVLIALAVAVFPLGGRIAAAHGEQTDSASTAAKPDCHGTTASQHAPASDALAGAPEPDTAHSGKTANCCDFGCHVMGSASIFDGGIKAPLERRAEPRAALLPPDSPGSGLQKPPRTTRIG